MAKWGEGDPRWIVEERPDATNCNNWHWTEKNASNWSKDKITTLLTGIALEDSVGSFRITELSTIEGEAVANNRKAKLIFFYEWIIKGKWVGKAKDGEHEIKGEFEIPNLSEENDPNEIDVTVSYTENSEHDKDQAIKEMFRIKGTEMIQKQLGIYVKELKEEYAKDLVLPTKDSIGKSGDTKTKPEQVKSVTKLLRTPVIENKTSTSDAPINLSSLRFEEEFKCTASDFYNALTQVELVSRFTQNEAICVNKVGGEFKLFGGNIEGTFTELVKDKLIKQKWRFKSWPANHYSNVTFNIKSKEDCIVLELSQDNIPASEFDKVEQGWKRYYFEALRRSFGFGSTLM